MPKTVKYIGTAQRWPELAATGKQSVWMPGQMEERSDAEAAQLLFTGLFVANVYPAFLSASGDALVGPDGYVQTRNKLEVLAARPIGFNYYSLVYEILINSSTGIASRSTVLDYIVSCGANIVRFALPVFSSAQYLSLVHSTTSMPSTMTDSNLRSTYVAAIDAAMDALAARGLKAHVCDGWGQDYLPGALGETRAQAYGSLTSATTLYSIGAAKWFFNRYRSHAAFGVYSLGNEYVTDPAGVTGPTDAQMGAWFTAVANAARTLDKTKIITHDSLYLAAANSATRTTLDQYATTLRTWFAGLDAYCIHIYGNGFNYIGAQVLEDAAFPNSSSTDLGWEGAPALLEALRAIADADKKPLLIGEFGIPTDEEADAANDKKARCMRPMVQFAEYSLIWNVQDSTLANTIPNQVKWYIAPSTTRATTFQALASAMNAAKPMPIRLAGGTKGLRTQLQPRYAFKGTRVSDATVKFTSSAAHASSNGYATLFWLRLDAPLNSNEFIIGLNGANTSGIAIVANAVANAQGFYYETRSAGGSVGNTPNMTPDVVLGEWNHFAFTSEGVNGGAAIRIYLNGLYFRTIPASAAPTSIIAAVNMFIGGGNSNFGIPASYQDICLAPSISPQDVWDHMQGRVLPQALLHVRARPNRSAVDLSKNAAAITFGAGVSIVQV